MANPPPPQEANPRPTENRRSFFTAILAAIAGVIALLAPLAAGLAVFLSPLWRRNKNPQVRVALLSQVPDDGTPRFFPVIADREDAWNRYPQQRIGGVYLVRQPGASEPTAFSAKCPHAGCFIGYKPGEHRFQCPCHTSAFELDGVRIRGDEEVAPRDMDRLPVELREIEMENDENAFEVWVEFIDFQTGHKEQIRSA